MPRKNLRDDLAEQGVMLNKQNVEIGRMTLNGVMVLNTVELFFEVERWAGTHYNRCSVNHLNAVFSRAGTWGYDSTVAGAIKELLACDVVEYADPDSKFLRPIVSAKVALDRLPRYITRAEAHAGLEPIYE